MLSASHDVFVLDSGLRRNDDKARYQPQASKDVPPKLRERKMVVPDLAKVAIGTWIPISA
ncbi:hypothetical protein GCM10010981_28940 [Dyella nitratireducens]|uniref:Uncharacterized protein n=1 Tax=Dyella nitratireducens TaxID=1849580 RepID=A0ABQ1G702_9GAMM|nr:hypothetical protein GCM10010981_28940 [Dyella nitratireducens]